MRDDQAGRYRLVRRLGAGGMADVFRAELVGAEGITRDLVVKRILPSLSNDAEAVAMFVEEARIAARLHHPNVVQVYEFGRSGDRYFLAMELVDGCDLAALLRHERPSLDALAWVFLELLDGLAYVHALRGSDGAPLGLVHRDVSPHNVLLGAAGEVKLADFGIATVAARVEPDGGVRGKYAYMAPEHARGEALDARADLFAVGAMLYEALTGRRVFPSVEGRVALDDVREGRVRREPIAHAELAAVLAKATASDRDDRWPDARSFRDALLRAFASAGARADREALRAAVEALRDRVAVPSMKPGADRTLTVPGEEGSVPYDRAEASVREGTAQPGGERFEPVPSPSRRILERVGIAVGIFTLAVLAERKTRPAPPRDALVRVALPDEASLRAWFDGDARRSVERACRCRVTTVPWRDARALRESMRRGEVDLAAVTTTALAAVSEGAALAPAPRTSEALRDELRALPEVAPAMVPVALDVVVLGYRAEAVRAVPVEVRAHQTATDARVTAALGEAPPARVRFERDPAYWTWWDLLAAADAWATAGTARVWLDGSLETWTARVAAAPGVAVAALRTGADDREAWARAIRWQRLLAPSIVRGVADGSVPNDSTVTALAAAVGPARWFVAQGDWELAPVPLDAALSGPAVAADRRVARVGAVLGWVTSAQGATRATVRAAAAVLHGATERDAMAEAWNGLPARRDAVLSGEPAWMRRMTQEEEIVRGAALTLVSAGAGAEYERVARAMRSLAAVGEGDAREAAVRAVWEGAFGPR